MEKSPDASSTKRALGVLRRELEADTEPARRASLAFELARLAESNDDAGAAARDALQATNLAGGFTEPLEMLLRIAERRRSSANAEKLLERLLRVAKTDAERRRAGFALLAQVLERGDIEAAENLLSELESHAPADPTLALVRHRIAALERSNEDVVESLVARSRATEHPALRAELLELAALRRLDAPATDAASAEFQRDEARDFDGAITLLSESLLTFVTYRRLELLENLAIRAQRPDVAAETTERLRELVDAARASTTTAEDARLAPEELTPAHERELLFRQVLHTARAGRSDDALELLRSLDAVDSVSSDVDSTSLTRFVDPLQAAVLARTVRESSEPLEVQLLTELEIVEATLARAERDATSGDDSTVDERVGLLLVAGWLQGRLGRHDSAVEHFERALVLEPTALLPQVLQLRAIAAGRTTDEGERGDDTGDAFALALESWAERLQPIAGSSTTRAQLLVTAALLHAPSDGARAMRLLEAARDAGFSSSTMRRLLRVLALVGGRQDLVLLADLALLDLAPENAALVWEALGIGFRLERTSSLERALDHLPRTDFERVFLESFLIREPDRASDDAAGSSDDARPARRRPVWPEALERSLHHESLTPELQRAWSLVQVTRELADDDRRTAALSRLRSLWEATPSDPVVTSALTEWLRKDDPARAGRAFLRAARATDDADLGELWALEAAFALFRGGRYHEVVDALGLAGAPGETALGSLELLLLRALGSGGDERRAEAEKTAARSGDLEAALSFATTHFASDRDTALEVLEVFASAPTDDDASSGQRGASPQRRIAASERGRLFRNLLDPETDGDSLLDRERSLLALARLEPSRVEERVTLARHWLEALEATPNDHGAGSDTAESSTTESNGGAALRAERIDAALSIAALSSSAGFQSERAAATTTLGGLLDAPLLTSWGQALHTDDSSSAASPFELAHAQPDSIELGWLALESLPVTSSDERLTTLAQLASALRKKSGDDNPDPTSLELVLAFHHLARGDSAAALPLFERLSESLSSDPSVWLGLERAARRENRPDLEVVALTARAEQTTADERASVLWEKAGDLHRDRLDKLDAAEAAYCAALARNPRSSSAFERVYRLAKARGDRARLFELIDGRLDVPLDARARAELLWEKARLSRHLGRRSAALRALEQLLELEPEHLRALALSAEMHLVDERLEHAAEALRAVALHADTPAEETRAAGLHATDLFERLHRPREAVELLQALETRGVDEALLVERKARSAARAGNWQVAYQASERWNDASDALTERLQSARMMLAIQRDHLKEPRSLEDAARRVLRDAPLDGDAVDVVLGGGFSPEERARLLAAPLEDTVRKLRDAPLQPAHLARLVELSEATESERFTRIALGATALTGRLSDERKRALDDALGATKTPAFPLSSDDFDSVAVNAEVGPPGRFARLLSSHLEELSGPDLESLGVTAHMRLDPFGDHPLRREISAWTTFFGIGDFEFYSGGDDPNRIAAFSRDFVTIILGETISTPLSPRDRARLASSLYAVTRGLGPWLTLSIEEGEAWIRGALRAIGAPLASTASEPTDDELARSEALAARLSREERDELLEMAELASTRAADLTSFPLVARSSAARLVTLLAGEPSILRSLPRLVPADPEGRRLLLSEVIRFALADEFPLLRRKTGEEKA